MLFRINLVFFGKGHQPIQFHDLFPENVLDFELEGSCLELLDELICSFPDGGAEDRVVVANNLHQLLRRLGIFPLQQLPDGVLSALVVLLGPLVLLVVELNLHDELLLVLELQVLLNRFYILVLELCQ